MSNRGLRQIKMLLLTKSINLQTLPRGSTPSMGIMQVCISMIFSMAVLLNNLVAVTINDLRSLGEISQNLTQPKSSVLSSMFGSVHFRTAHTFSISLSIR